MSILLSVVVLGALAAGIVLAPRLEDPAAAANRAAEIELAKARRHLVDFDPALALVGSLRQVHGEAAFQLPEGEAKFAQRIGSNSLRSAQTAVDAAVREDSNHGGANQFKGTVLFQQGTASAMILSAQRTAMAAYRAEISKRWELVQALQSDLKLAERSNVAARIETAAGERQRLEADVRSQEQLVTQLQGRVDELRGALDAVQGESEAARGAKEALEDRGLDFASPDGLASFTAEYMSEANKYRLAVQQAQILEFGTLENATLEFQGDPVHGRYVPILEDQQIGYQRGLRHYERDLDLARAGLEGLRAALAQANQNVDAMQELSSRLGRKAERARAVVAEHIAAISGSAGGDTGGEDDDEDGGAAAGETAASGLEGLLAVWGTADERNTFTAQVATTLRHFEDSSKAFRKAASTLERSEAGNAMAHEGEALLAIALVRAAQLQEAQANQAVFERLADHLDVADAIAACDEVIDGADEIVELAHEARGKFEEAQGRIGEGNWMVAAEVGAAFHLLAQLGQPDADRAAVAWYTAAVEDRRDAGFVQPYLDVLQSIERQVARQGQ